MGSLEEVAVVKCAVSTANRPRATTDDISDTPDIFFCLYVIKVKKKKSNENFNMAVVFIFKYLLVLFLFLFFGF